MRVNIKKLDNKAVIPKYAKNGDAGMDLTATRVIISSKYQTIYGTDISMKIPDGYVGLVYPRSSIRKYDLTLANSVGVIDSGYTGELLITFNKLKANGLIYDIGDRVAQIIIMPYPKIEFIEVYELLKTERGHHGHGSSGIK